MTFLRKLFILFIHTPWYCVKSKGNKSALILQGKNTFLFTMFCVIRRGYIIIANSIWIIVVTYSINVKSLIFYLIIVIFSIFERSFNHKNYNKIETFIFWNSFYTNIEMPSKSLTISKIQLLWSTNDIPIINKSDFVRL